LSAVVAIVVIASTIFVLVDAGKYDWSRSGVARRPGAWAAGVFLLWIVFFPLYLIKRGSAPVKRPAYAGQPTGAVSAPVSPSISSPPPPPPPTAGPPASWYPDPRGARRLRYWDGRQWTEHTAD
jgi:hypothetical protein